MIKYANNDINDGMTLIKVGLSNIITTIINENIKEYILNFPFDEDILISLLHYAVLDLVTFKEYIDNEVVYRLHFGKKGIRIYHDNPNEYTFKLV